MNLHCFAIEYENKDKDIYQERVIFAQDMGAAIFFAHQMAAEAGLDIQVGDHQPPVITSDGVSEHWQGGATVWAYEGISGKFVSMKDAQERAKSTGWTSEHAHFGSFDY